MASASKAPAARPPSGPNATTTRSPIPIRTMANPKKTTAIPAWLAYAHSVADHDDHRPGIAVEQPAPFLDHGLDLPLERVRFHEILHLFIEGRAHGRRTRERTKGLSRAQPTGSCS